MRIAVVTTSYPASPDDACGHFVRAEALELARLGHEVHVVAPEPDRALMVRSDDALRIWSLPHGAAFGWPGAASRVRHNPWRAAGAAGFAALAMARLNALRPDRIVAHWLVPCAWPIALGSRCPAELHAIAHGADVRMLLGMPAPVRERLVSALLHREVKLRFVAHTLRDALVNGLSPSLGACVIARSSVRPASVSVPDVTARARELRRQCEAPILATVAGRLVQDKRVELAIGAAGLLDGRMHLAVAGDGPDAERLRLLADAGHVRFLGRVPRHDALAWIAASDVLIHPSAVEAAPTVVREARALGTSVVACASGDVERWAGDDRGIVIAEPTVASIARAVFLFAPTPGKASRGEDASCHRDSSPLP